jgi:histidyl-tRNA synthetase
VLNGLLEKLRLADQSTAVLRALDKLPKIGPDKVVEEMTRTASATVPQADQVLAFAQITGPTDQVLGELEKLVSGSQVGVNGVERLSRIVAGTRAAGVPDDRLRLDVSIARGLDYYTGTIIETFLDQLPEIGSVCSGGRYDDLAGAYTRQHLPGIGASLGLDRLLAAMEELALIENVSTPATVFVAYFHEPRLHDYLRLAAGLRAEGLAVELFPEPKRLGQQLKYADRRGFKLAVIAGEDEFNADICQLKDLRTGDSQQLPLDSQKLASAIHGLLDDKGKR